MKKRIIIGAVIALAAAFLMPGTTGAEEPACPDGTYAIYTDEEVLAACLEEEWLGSPESCPDDALPGYLASGELVGCFMASITAEEVCGPTGVDADGDNLDDGCDPCPESADCDGDGFCDGSEVYLGTDPLDACPDDPSDDAWPLDINMDTYITAGGDVLPYRGRLQASGGPPPDPNWVQRLDINADNFITMSGDVLLFRDRLQETCAEDVAGAPSGGGTWCFACTDWSAAIRQRKEAVHGAFYWTVPIPFLPDLKKEMYSLHLWATFLWLDNPRVFGISETYSFADAVKPYYLGNDGWPTIVLSSSGPMYWKVQSEIMVEVFPGVGDIPHSYKIYVWEDSCWQYGGKGFHEIWK